MMGIIAIALLAVGILMPFIYGVYAGLKGKSVMDIRNQASDSENIKTALLKEQVNILDKNRRDSWTSPTYFKK